MLLPSNTKIFGRPNKPSSHYLFALDPKAEAYQQFTDLDGKTTLVELRAKTSHQTVLPPSVHASGDTLAWANDFPLVFAELEALQILVRSVAIATLLARHWPSGSRHAAAGHVAGLLFRLKFPPADIPRIVRAIAVAAKDEEPSDRERAARDTVEKLGRGESRVTGGPALAKLLGTSGVDILSRINTWCDRDDYTEVDKLNASHFVVQIGKDMVVGTEYDDAPVTFLSFHGFNQRYYNRYVGKTKLGEFWLAHANRRENRKVVFAPPPLKSHPLDYNLWKGFTCDPLETWTRAPIERYLMHIFEVIASGKQEHYDYILDLLAETAQHPGRPTGKVLAMRGAQGTGKSLFMTAFGSLFGRHYAVVSNRQHVIGNFNAHLSGKVVVFADEALWGGDRQNVGTWKRLVTEKTVMIERKGIDAIEEPNCIHLFLASNEDWMAPAGERERRLVIVDVNETERTHAHYEALAAEIEHPLFKPTLLTMLLTRDVSAGRWRGGLDTRALREQQDYSGGPVQQWWALKLADGYVGTADGRWPDFIVLQDVYVNFVEEMKELGRHNNLGTRTLFARKLHKYLPPGTEYCVRMVDIAAPGDYVRTRRVPRRGAVLPGLHECRRYFDSVLKSNETWLSPSAEDAELPLEVRPDGGPF